MKYFITLLVVILVMASPGTRADNAIPDNGGQPIEIQTLVFFTNIEAINSARQSYTGSVYFSLIWMDKRLAHDGDSSIRMDLDDVWHPGAQVVNQQKVWTTYDDEVTVEPSGLVTLRQRLWGDFAETMELQDFPFDRQEFRFSVVSTGYDKNQVQFVPQEGFDSGISEDLTLPDWNITGVSAGSDIYNPVSQSDLEIPGFTFRFEASRDHSYYIFKVILPLLLLVAMSWLAFWISVEEAGTQISVSITTILTLIAYRFAIGSSLPAVAYLTRIDEMIMGATLLTFAALFVVVYIQHLRRSDRLERARATQMFSRVIFPIGLLATVLKSLVL